VDGNNLGPSYIQAIGEHTGGALWTGDQGVVDCNGHWKKFNGCAMHATQPFEGTRISLIPFTNNAFEELDDKLCTSLRSLGFEAVGTARIRDRGDVAEETFDEHWVARRKSAIASLEVDAAAAKEARQQTQEKNPKNTKAKVGSACTDGCPKLIVDVAGWACGRGSAWVAFDTGKKQAIQAIDFPKNTTGFHCVELALNDRGPPSKLVLQSSPSVRFHLYQKLEDATKKFCKWVDKLPEGRVVVIAIADTAIAKTRPLGPEIYDSLRKLGAAEECDVIGYRNPFAFIGVKGGAKGSAMYCLDKHAQSKTMLRAEATVSLRRDATGVNPATKPKGKAKGKKQEEKAGKNMGRTCVELVKCRSSRTLATEKIETIDKGSTAPCTGGSDSGGGSGGAGVRKAKRARTA
jgi:hypothetical protein